MEDGTVSIFGLVFGVASSTTSSSVVLLAGATGAISAAVSMMAGTFLDVESTNDQAKAQLAREQTEIDNNLKGEKQEIRDRLQTAGFNDQDTTAIVQATIQAWEEQDPNALASYLSDDVICKQILPQSIGKAQLLAFMKAITTAFPDWSFNGHVLHEESLAEHIWSVLFVTAVTGTQTGDLILPPLPIIPATGTKIALPYGHLEWLVTGDTITAITADFSPSGLEEVLAQLGLELP